VKNATQTRNKNVKQIDAFVSLTLPSKQNDAFESIILPLTNVGKERKEKLANHGKQKGKGDWGRALVVVGICYEA
jgi:hypothetical protein